MKIFKTLLFGSAFLLLCNSAFAQNNLQFNSVQFMPLVCGAGGFPFDSTVVIPTGKVWKVEAAASDGGNIQLNGTTIRQYTTSTMVCPIWLPAGTYTFSIVNMTSLSSVKGFVSAIEYNLVP